jgi:hypothetical protein
MVDFATYKELHSDTFRFEQSYPEIDNPDCERLDPQIFENDDPPQTLEVYVFPNSLVAYNLRSKKWSKY